MAHSDIWTTYSQKLYDWINQKYSSLMDGELSEDEYYACLQFYEAEIQVVSVITSGDSLLLQLDEVKELKELLETEEWLNSPNTLIELRFQQSRSENENGNTSKGITAKVITETAKAELEELEEIMPATKKKFVVPDKVKSRIQKSIQEMSSTNELKVAIAGSSGSGKTTIRAVVEGKKRTLRHHKGFGATISVAKLTRDKSKGKGKVKVFLIELDSGKQNEVARKGFYKSADKLMIILDASVDEDLYFFQQILREIREVDATGKPCLIVLNKVDRKKKIKKKQLERVISQVNAQRTPLFSEMMILETTIKKPETMEKIRTFLVS